VGKDARERLGCVSVDLDSLHHYCRIHGLPEASLPERALDLVYSTALPRFLDLCAELSVPLTLFAIGEDLAREPSARALRDAHRAGAEVGNHSCHHDYALTRRTREQIHLEVGRLSMRVWRRLPVSGPGYASHRRALPGFGTRRYTPRSFPPRRTGPPGLR
jgi:peptidoglycan/xylan/chitin deacetylase (PgdA/CDA1 family)